MIKTTVPRGRSNNSKGVGNSSKDGHSAERWSERPAVDEQYRRLGYCSMGTVPAARVL
jgi:hypothetical protein